MPKATHITLDAGGVLPRPGKNFENSQVRVSVTFELEGDETYEQVFEEHAEAVAQLSNSLHEITQLQRG